MPYDTLAIANAFIGLAAEAGERLTPTKSQKLVYYAHGWNLASYGKPLLGEVIQAWSFGPVVRSVCNRLRRHGGREIDSKGDAMLAKRPDLIDLKPKLPEPIAASATRPLVPASGRA